MAAACIGKISPSSASKRELFPAPTCGTAQKTWLLAPDDAACRPKRICLSYHGVSRDKQLCLTIKVRI